MTCHRGVKSCTQHCPHGGCRLACLAQKCIKSMPVPPSATISSTPTLQNTLTMSTRQVTMVTDREMRTTLMRSDVTHVGMTHLLPKYFLQAQNSHGSCTL